MTENLARTARSLSNVRVHPCALAAERGTATFYAPADDHMLASLANWSGQTVNEISIPVDTLDYISAVRSAPALVKIEVEGPEDLVLQGGTQLLQSPTPPIIFFEQVPKAATAFGYDPCATQRRIRETGQFTLYRILSSGYLEPLPLEYGGLANLLAVPGHLAGRIDPSVLRR